MTWHERPLLLSLIRSDGSSGQAFTSDLVRLLPSPRQHCPLLSSGSASCKAPSCSCDQRETEACRPRCHSSQQAPLQQRDLPSPCGSSPRKGCMRVAQAKTRDRERLPRCSASMRTSCTRTSLSSCATSCATQTCRRAPSAASFPPSSSPHFRAHSNSRGHCSVHPFKLLDGSRGVLLVFLVSYTL